MVVTALAVNVLDCVATVAEDATRVVAVTVLPEVTVTVGLGPVTVTVAAVCGNFFEQKS